MMRRSTAAILSATCLGLLATQWTGLHAHINAQGFHGAAQVMQHHHHDDGNGDSADDHDGDIDVRVVDYGLGASKLLVFLFATALPLFLVLPARTNLLQQGIDRFPLRRRVRWGPPLRGPPPAFVIA